MSISFEGLMTPQELARYLRVSKNKVYHLVKQNGMPAYAIGSSLRFCRKQIDSWLKKFCGKNIDKVINAQNTVLKKPVDNERR